MKKKSKRWIIIGVIFLVIVAFLIVSAFSAFFVKTSPPKTLHSYDTDDLLVNLDNHNKLIIPNLVHIEQDKIGIIRYGIKNNKSTENLNCKVELQTFESKAGQKALSSQMKYIYDETLKLSPNEAKVYPIKISAEAEIGNYLVELKITDTDNNITYAQKSFFITVE